MLGDDRWKSDYEEYIRNPKPLDKNKLQQIKDELEPQSHKLQYEFLSRIDAAIKPFTDFGIPPHALETDIDYEAGIMTVKVKQAYIDEYKRIMYGFFK